MDHNLVTECESYKDLRKRKGQPNINLKSKLRWSWCFSLHSPRLCGCHSNLGSEHTALCCAQCDVTECLLEHLSPNPRLQSVMNRSVCTTFCSRECNGLNTENRDFWKSTTFVPYCVNIKKGHLWVCLRMFDFYSSCCLICWLEFHKESFPSVCTWD